MNGPADPHFELTPNDRRLLDELIEAEFDIESMEPLSDAERERVEALANLFGLLNDYPVEEADDTLIHATIARIDRHEAEARLKFDPVSDRSEGLFRGPRVPLIEILAIAAVLLIAVGVGWPILGQLRANSIDRICANNMRQLALAFDSYAQDYDNVLPTAMTGIGSASWDTVRNLVNLRPLLDYGYCDHDYLNCPGNHDQNGSSYSYQWQPPAEVFFWNTGSAIVILGDRNPLIDATLFGNVMPADSTTINHGGRGQNVLMSDGAVRWLTEPKIGRDNIWLPEGTMFLQTGQQPSGTEDAFLVH